MRSYKALLFEYLRGNLLIYREQYVNIQGSYVNIQRCDIRMNKGYTVNKQGLIFEYTESNL